MIDIQTYKEECLRLCLDPTIAEHMLQQALRKLRAAIEGDDIKAE